MNCSHCGAPLEDPHRPCSFCSARSRTARKHRSKRGDIVVRLTFENQLDEEVDVFWLDYAGQPVLYRTLDPGESATQETFETHPWELISERGRTLIVIAGPHDTTVTFHAGVGSKPGT